MKKTWSEKKIKYIARINPSKSEVTHLPSTTAVTFLPMEYISENGVLDLTNIQTIADTYNGFTYFRENDIIIAKITPCFENGKGALCEGLENGIGFGTTELHVLRPSENIVPKFLYYVSKSHPFRSIGTATMKGAAGQKRVTDEFISQYKIAFPSTAQQMKIVEFIDNNVERIDKLIEKKQKLVELLQEKRQAIIDEAVTKGLNPNTPMKDTGIEWLGKVPAHWQVKRIKYVAKMESGHTPDKKKPEYWDGNIPWVSLNDSKFLRNNDYIGETSFYTTKLGIANSSAKLLPINTVVFSRDASIGLCAITTSEMAVSQHFIGWVCGTEIYPEYLLQVLKCMSQELEKLSWGATVKTIGMPDVKKMITPVPPQNEQEVIISAIKSSTERIDITIHKVKLQIDKLMEYRQSLISEAVTGKLNVRDYVKEVVQ